MLWGNLLRHASRNTGLLVKMGVELIVQLTIQKKSGEGAIGKIM